MARRAKLLPKNRTPVPDGYLPGRIWFGYWFLRAILALIVLAIIVVVILSIRG
jgi:uncharacterized membrane protein